MRVSEAALALITRVNAQGKTEYLTQWNEKWQAYSLIGGHREEGESFRQCCIRQVEEELGLKRDVDFTIAADPVGPTCEYTAFSKATETKTRYRLELFQVHLLVLDGLSRLENTPSNQWVKRSDIAKASAPDGKKIALQVGIIVNRFAINESILPRHHSVPLTTREKSESYNDRLRFPVIRIHSGLFKCSIIAVYERHILAGSRRFWPISLTEEMCHDNGIDSLRQHLSKHVTIAFSDVTEVRETISLTERERERSFFHSTQTNINHFTICTSGGRNVDFTVPQSQIGTIHDALFRQVPDRYFTRPEKRGGCGAAGLLLLSLPCFLIAVLVIATQDRWVWHAAGYALIILSAAILCCGVYFLSALRGSWSRADTPPVSLVLQRENRITRPKSKSAPLRSPLFGWLLKLAGLAYWIAIASPISDPLQAAMEASNTQQHMKTIIWGLVWAPSPLLVYWGYQMCQRKYNPTTSQDTRRPILYLRSFDDDAHVTLQPPGLVSALSGIREPSTWRPSNMLRHSDDGGRAPVTDLIAAANPLRLVQMIFDRGAGTAEESIARYFEFYGPVIAIGKPGEVLATPGAARAYVADDEWQALVLRECKRSQAVVIQPGTTEGVSWELEQVRTHVEPHKVLLSLVGFWMNPDRYDRLCGIAERSLWVKLPRVVPFMERPAFVWFDSEWTPHLQELSHSCPAIWPLTVDAVDLKYTLHPFAQGIHGGEREQPRVSAWKRGFATTVARFAAVAIGVVFAFLPIVLVRNAVQIVFPSSHQVDVSSSSRAENIAVPIQQVVKASPRIMLKGNVVAYSLLVPESLTMEVPSESLIEHTRISPDKKLVVTVLAVSSQEDVSNLALQRQATHTDDLQKLNQPNTAVTVESTRTVEVAGKDWVESRILVTLEGGIRARETARARSEPSGTIYCIIQVFGTPDFDDEYLAMCDEILQSLRIERVNPDEVQKNGIDIKDIVNEAFTPK